MPSRKIITKSPTDNVAYQKLFNSIAKLYDAAMKDVAGAVDSILKKAYWEIGKMVVENEQKGELRAAYGENLLEKLSDDLTKSNRKGFSATNLRNMRRVFQAFPIQQNSAELTWSHYVLLSSVQDDKDRSAYLKKAIDKKWNFEKLKEVLMKDQVKTVLLENTSAASQSVPAKDIKIPRLAVRRGLLNTYQIVSEGKDKELLIDLGFRCYRELPASLKLKEGNLARILERSRDQFTAELLPKTLTQPKSVLYTFQAYTDKVIDGDTIKVRAVLGLGIFKKQKLRLKKINAPEIDTKAGILAKNFVENTLKTCPLIVIKTYSTDIYDRYLADIFYLPGCDDPEKVASEGIYLNQELIDKGLAELWQTPDPTELAFLN